MSLPLSCAVMIPTHNRLDDLQRTLDVVAQLEPRPDEVLITADGCTDATVDFLRTQPHRVIVNPVARGSTASRDAMMRAAESELVLSLDDDSHPIERDAIARVRALFAARPRLAVASFPQRSDEAPESLAQPGFGPPAFVGTYVNCACAFRRRVLPDLGGHFGPFWNAYDEADFAVRCLAAGWEVRFEPSVTIRHHYSGVNRNHQRVHRMHARNELWSVFMRCPALPLPGIALFRAARQFGYARRRGLAWMLGEPRWWWACLAGLPAALGHRRAVPWRHYLAWMRLVRQPIAAETEGRKRAEPAA